MKLSIETPSVKVLNKLIKKNIIQDNQLDTYKIIVNEYNEIQGLFNKKTFKIIVINNTLEKEINKIVTIYKSRKNKIVEYKNYKI